MGASDTAYALVVGGWMAGTVLAATTLAHRVPGRLLAGAALVALAVQGAGMGGQAVRTVLPGAFAAQSAPEACSSPRSAHALR